MACVGLAESCEPLGAEKLLRLGQKEEWQKGKQRGSKCDQIPRLLGI